MQVMMVLALKRAPENKVKRLSGAGFYLRPAATVTVCNLRIQVSTIWISKENPSLKES